MNLAVYKRLVAFLGEPNAELTEACYDHYKRSSELTSEELAGIDVLAHQFDYVGERRGYAYNKALAWRDGGRVSK